MISEFEQQLIDQAQYQEDIQSCVKIAAGSKNPYFLAQYASAYNWDDGVDVARAIIDNPCCDLGTALTVFWLAEGISHFTGEARRNEYNGAWADLCEELISRLPSGFYTPGKVSYDPELNQVQIYKLRKLEVPPVFYAPVLGNS